MHHLRGASIPVYMTAWSPRRTGTDAAGISPRRLRCLSVAAIMTCHSPRHQQARFPLRSPKHRLAFRLQRSIRSVRDGIMLVDRCLGRHRPFRCLPVLRQHIRGTLRALFTANLTDAPPSWLRINPDLPGHRSLDLFITKTNHHSCRILLRRAH
jgi:hypothetical protein